MIGQAQVTEPLMTALRNDRVGHAYLFSGPRGCGKTTSARILARCLNCAAGPTDTPCGTCDSCVELSRAGGGSLDVVEIDAASHNGVDDARDLRERAIFAPARDRFKIFILDEAHMVTQQGFNALLKLVEEPPDHVKFIFATTEPDKVLGTIRSRTHHYPFRLVPPGPMLEYVAEMCESEGVQVEPGVLPLVVRAGGGSPRDTLSLLDQLIAGSDVAGGAGSAVTVRYERAVALLGYTHAALLDEVVDAIAGSDAAAAFGAVDRVVQTGQDPRRFVDDLLERLRDLIVVAATGADAGAVLRGISAEELERMIGQSAAFGAERLSRVADLVSHALDDMTGATSPRLQLELMIARVLASGGPVAVGGAVGGGAAHAAPVSTATATPASAAPAVAAAAVVAPAVATPVVSAPVVPSGPLTFESLTTAWPQVLTRLESISRTSWFVASAATVHGVENKDDHDVVALGFRSPSELTKFKPKALGGGDAFVAVRQAIGDVLGVNVRFMPRVDPDGPGGPGGGGGAPDVPGAPDASPDTAARPDSSARPSAGPAQASAAPASGGAGSSRPAAVQAASAAAPVTEWAVARIPGSSGSPAESASSAPVAVVAEPAAAPVAAAPVVVEPVVVEPVAAQAAPVSVVPPASAAAGAAPAPTTDDEGWALPSDDWAPEPDAPEAPVPADPSEQPRAVPVASSLAVDAEPDEVPYESAARVTDIRATTHDGDVLDPHVPLDEDDAAREGTAPERPITEPAARLAPVTEIATRQPVRTSVDDGVLRYGEAGVRQILDATFVREEPYQAATRFTQ